MGLDDQLRFPEISRNRHPATGYPLPDLPPHGGSPARPGQRGPDRALPPRPPREARRRLRQV